MAKYGQSKLRLTPAEVHEIRLSPETLGVLSRRFKLSVTTLHRVRNDGDPYGRLTFEERVANKRRRDGLDQSWLFSEYQLVVNSLFHDPEPVIDSQDRQEMMDAAHECAHGRLAGDSTPTCGCWPQEQSQPQGEQNGNHNHKDRVQRFTAQAVQAEQGRGEAPAVQADPRVREPV